MNFRKIPSYYALGFIAMFGWTALCTSPPTASAQSASGAEKIASDIVPEAIWDGRKIMPFKTLDFPDMVYAYAADYLDDSDYVLGVVVNGEPRAYPTRFIWWHHLINDRGGLPENGAQVPFVVSYCSVCNTGIRYNPVVNGKTLMFDFFGLYNGVVTVCERETQTVFLQAEGRGIKGALTGTQLKAEPLLDTTWGVWKRLHPTTLVMNPKPPFEKYYSKRGKPEPRGYEKFPAPFFQPTVTRGDLRLPPFQKVMGAMLPVLENGEERWKRRAYPIANLMQNGYVLEDRFEGKNVVALLEPDSQTANLFVRNLPGMNLSFVAMRTDAGKVEFRDKETWSCWNIEGVCDEGSFRGRSLERIENHLSQWYGWSAYFPDTTIFGRNDPPMPGDPFKKPEPKSIANGK